MNLEDFLDNPYASYAYSYPHKTAYRALAPPVALRDAWQSENRDSLFLYLHVPYCEMRCGFCNLFTATDHRSRGEARYLETLARQAVRVRDALRDASFSRMAIGGGTPTILSPDELHRLFDIAEIFSVENVPVSVETSPGCATPQKLQVLRERGTTRISIGVQSWVESEVRAAGRAQRTVDVETALANIRAANFPILNIDLMYGLPGQTVKSWLDSLRSALRWTPEEIYLYPLYVRPLTGLARRANGEENDIRLRCYRAARERLLNSGYRQVSMRMFQSTKVAPETPLYCCQQDGMIGLGAGARSYTSRLHYSSEYAVGASGVREILADYIARDDESFDFADYGFHLDADEQRRRYLIQSLLQAEGLNLENYARRFGGAALDDVPQLSELTRLELAELNEHFLRLNAAGLERSDIIGPWLASARVRSEMQSYALR